MRRKLLILLALVVVLSLVIAVPVGAKKPLTGEMDLSRVGAPCPDGTFTWGGTVAFPTNSEGPSGSYDMVFIKLGTGKPFDSPPPPDTFPPGNVSFFGEIWAIYADGVVLVAGCPDISAAAIWGYDSGVVTFRDFDPEDDDPIIIGKYRMNGDVQYVDPLPPPNPFLGWEGRKVHMSGDIVLDPFTAPGTFRLN